jgi:Protein of unknown function (DUF3987)
VARFAFAVPESLLGRRRHLDAEIPAQQREAWEAIVRAVYSQNPLTKPPKMGYVSYVSTKEVGDFRLSLSPSGRKLLYELRVALEARLREDGDLRPHADWINRHPARVARIAALIHLAGEGGTSIGEQAMGRALQIGDYLLAHGLAVLAEPDEQTRRALRWLGEHDEPSVSVRDLQRGPLSNGGSAKDAKALAARLEELGALRRLDDTTGALVELGKGKRAGRPAGPRFEINPHLRARR